MSFFEAKNISCIRGNKLVFKNLNFKARSGELIVIKGANGSGKSSLLKILCGLLKPTSGSIKFALDKEEIKSKEDLLTHIDYVGHENALKDALTVKENLSFYYKLRRQGKFFSDFAKSSLEKEHIKLVTQNFNLENLLDVKVENLSSGEKRRVSLSRLCVNFVTKKIWLLDEPTNNLDKKNSALFLEELKKQHHSPDTITIMTSHDDIKFKWKNTINL